MADTRLATGFFSVLLISFEFQIHVIIIKSYILRHVIQQISSQYIYFKLIMLGLYEFEKAELAREVKWLVVQYDFPFIFSVLLISF
jgi:hypothetical protein